MGHELETVAGAQRLSAVVASPASGMDHAAQADKAAAAAVAEVWATGQAETCHGMSTCAGLLPPFLYRCHHAV